MPITITSSVQSDSQQWRLAVVLMAQTAIVDPTGYVATSTTVQAEILAKAGLDEDLVYVSTVLVSTSSVGMQYQYHLTVTFGASTMVGGGHVHDCDTIEYPLQCGYAAGPTIDLDDILGAVILRRPLTADIAMFAIQANTNNLLRVGPGNEIRFGAHQEFYPDNTYDVGTVDAGVTLRRPRDIRASRDLYAGGSGQFGGFGSFASYVLATHERFTAQAVNPSTGATVRHVYVNSVDNALHYWDGAVDHVIGTPAGSDTVGTWTCDTLVTQYDVVVCDAANHVTRAHASILAGRRPVGICVAKIDATTARVQYIGEVAGWVGLTPGATYFVAAASGAITADTTTLAITDSVVSVGVAKSTTTLVFQPGSPVL